MSEPNYTAPTAGGPTEPFGGSAEQFRAPTESFGAQPGYPQQPYPGVPQYPAGPAPAQYGGQPPLPPSNAGWAVASILFFWPLAFAAFNHLHSIFPKWSMGDYQGAQYASERVATLGKIALGIGVAVFVLAFFGWFVMIAAFTAAIDEATNTTTYGR